MDRPQQNIIIHPSMECGNRIASSIEYVATGADPERVV